MQVSYKLRDFVWGSGKVGLEFGDERDAPESVGGSLASDDVLVVSMDGDIMFVECDGAVVIAEDADGDEGVICESREDVGVLGGCGKAWNVDVAGMGGWDCTAVGELDCDRIDGGYFVAAGGVTAKVVACGSGVEDGGGL